MAPTPFDLRVFVAPLEQIVRVDVTTPQCKASGGYTPEQARILSAWFAGAADVAEGKATPAGAAFLEQARPENTEPSS